jgi:hypothetical protein
MKDFMPQPFPIFWAAKEVRCFLEKRAGQWIVIVERHGIAVSETPTASIGGGFRLSERLRHSQDQWTPTAA